MNPLIETWRTILASHEKPWVLFKNGTCVILMGPEVDISAQAIRLMKEWGRVYPGCSAGDFGTIGLNKAPGWVVTSHHNDILTYVGPEEVDADNPSDVVVGLIGRGKRDQDAQELEIIHVEDNRSKC